MGRQNVSMIYMVTDGSACTTVGLVCIYGVASFLFLLVRHALALDFAQNPIL